jgi:hypothetical protein
LYVHPSIHVIQDWHGHGEHATQRWLYSFFCRWSLKERTTCSNQTHVFDILTSRWKGLQCITEHLLPQSVHSWIRWPTYKGRTWWEEVFPSLVLFDHSADILH